MIKIKRRQGTAPCFEVIYYNIRNNLWIFGGVHSYSKKIKKIKTQQGMDVFFFAGKYLVQPFPLEWNSNLYENCNDPCEVNVTHNLGRKRKKAEVRTIASSLWNLFFPQRNSSSNSQTTHYVRLVVLCSLINTEDMGWGLYCLLNVQMTQAIANIFKLQQENALSIRIL